jgi:hypothetical protein
MRQIYHIVSFPRLSERTYTDTAGDTELDFLHFGGRAKEIQSSGRVGHVALHESRVN